MEISLKGVRSWTRILLISFPVVKDPIDHLQLRHSYSCCPLCWRAKLKWNTEMSTNVKRATRKGLLPDYYSILAIIFNIIHVFFSKTFFVLFCFSPIMAAKYAVRHVWRHAKVVYIFVFLTALPTLETLVFLRKVSFPCIFFMLFSRCFNRGRHRNHLQLLGWFGTSPQTHRKCYGKRNRKIALLLRRQGVGMCRIRIALSGIR